MIERSRKMRTAPAGAATRLSLLALSLMAAMSSANASSTPVSGTYFEYDELGRVIRQYGNNGQSTRYSYDGNGNLTSTQDAANRTTSYEYDALNRVKKILAPDNTTTTISHDGGDRVSSVTDPRNLTTSFSYDGFGQLWSQSSPDTGTTSFQYGDSGLRTKMTRNDNSEVNYSYDALGRLTSQTGGGESREYSYDLCGHGISRLCGAVAQGTIYFGYTPDGRVAVTRELWGGHDDWMLYDYDTLGRMIGINYGGAYATYTYADGQLSGVYLYDGTSNNPIATDIVLRPFGGVESWTYGNGLSRRYNYDLDGRVTGISVGDSQSVIQSLTYAYNASNEITAITNGIDASMNQNLGYDLLSRLTSVTSSKNEAITYDNNGNRTLTDWVAPIYNVVDATSNRISSDYNGVPGAGISYTHDARGNRSSQSWSGSSATYSYDPFNRLRTLSRTANTTYLSPGYVMATYPAGTTTYTVNALDQRVAKSGPLGTHRFVYGGAGNKLMSEYTAGAWHRYIWLGDEPIALQRNNQLYFIHSDHLLRPEIATDSAKIVQWRARNYHSDRGIVLDNIGGLNLGFAGQYFDAESGLWHNGFRDYDSRLGRYIQSDPIGLWGGMNPYSYVDGNPVNNVDPLGLTKWSIGVFQATGGKGLGAGVARFMASSECVKGEMAIVHGTISLLGAQFDAMPPLSFSGFTAEFNDNRNDIDPWALNGPFVSLAVSASFGGGVSYSSTQIGEARSDFGFGAMAGFAGGTSALFGMAGVSSDQRFKCECRK